MQSLAANKSCCLFRARLRCAKELGKRLGCDLCVIFHVCVFTGDKMGQRTCSEGSVQTRFFVHHAFIQETRQWFFATPPARLRSSRICPPQTIPTGQHGSDSPQSVPKSPFRACRRSQSFDPSSRIAKRPTPPQICRPRRLSEIPRHSQTVIQKRIFLGDR